MEAGTVLRYGSDSIKNNPGTSGTATLVPKPDKPVCLIRILTKIRHIYFILAKANAC
jgi:hypothetical protein